MNLLNWLYRCLGSCVKSLLPKSWQMKIPKITIFQNIIFWWLLREIYFSLYLYIRTRKVRFLLEKFFLLISYDSFNQISANFFFYSYSIFKQILNCETNFMWWAQFQCKYYWYWSNVTPAPPQKNWFLGSCSFVLNA